MIIVEQSLNVALAIADRALFMEKGQIRFEGSTAELADARRPRPSRVPGSLTCSDRILAVGFPKQVIFVRGHHRADLRRHGRRRRPRSSARPESSTSPSARWAASPPPCSTGWSSTGTCRSGCRSPSASPSAPSSAPRSSCVIVRRLFSAPRVILLVALIGAAQVLLFFQLILPDVTKVRPYPTAFSGSWRIGGVLVRGPELTAIVVIPVLVIALTALPQPHEVRAGHPGLGRQRRRRPALGHQHQADVDDRLGDRRRAGRHRGHALRAAQPAGRVGHRGRPRPAAAGARRRPHRRHGLDAAGLRRWHRHRDRREPHQLQLQRPAGPARPAPVRPSSSSRCWSAAAARAWPKPAPDGGPSPPGPDRSPPSLQSKWWVRSLPAFGIGFLALVALLPLVLLHLPSERDVVEPGPALRADRALAHRAHRLGRSALAGTVRVRRRRRHDHRRAGARRRRLPPGAVPGRVRHRRRRHPRRRPRPAPTRPLPRRHHLRVRGHDLVVAAVAATSSSTARPRPSSPRQTIPLPACAVQARAGRCSAQGSYYTHLPHRARRRPHRRRACCNAAASDDR